MPEIYTELTPPTSVTHSLTLPFTSPTAETLILAKTNILQVFTTTTVQTELTAPTPSTPDISVGHGADEEQGDFAGELALQLSKVEDVAKLVLLAEFTLAGEVTGLARITPAERCRRGNGADMLLVAFRDAKMSLLAWDVERQAVETVSLHYYEREEFWSPVVSEGLPSLLAADPGMRAVALKFAGDMLAVLPLRQDGEDEEMLMDAAGDVEMGDGGHGEEEDDWDPNAPEKMDTGEKPEAEKNVQKEKAGERRLDLPFLKSFVVSASQLDDAISHVVSLTFLHE